MRSYSKTYFIVICAILASLSAFAAEAGRSAGREDSGPPLELKVCDFITKAYGAVDPGLSKETLLQRAEELLNVRPVEDSGVYWVDSDNGYKISYQEITPDISAYAAFEGDCISEYTYFFMFPYVSASRDACNALQCKFSSAMLQEMKDSGVPIGSNPFTDYLFEVLAEYDGKYVNLRLLDDADTPESGQYLLIMEITPEEGEAMGDVTADLQKAGMLRTLLAERR